jgi:hypothetical protein
MTSVFFYFVLFLVGLELELKALCLLGESCPQTNAFLKAILFFKLKKCYDYKQMNGTEGVSQ